MNWDLDFGYWILGSFYHEYRTTYKKHIRAVFGFCQKLKRLSQAIYLGLCDVMCDPYVPYRGAEM